MWYLHQNPYVNACSLVLFFFVMENLWQSIRHVLLNLINWSLSLAMLSNCFTINLSSLIIGTLSEMTRESCSSLKQATKQSRIFFPHLPFWPCVSVHHPFNNSGLFKPLPFQLNKMVRSLRKPCKLVNQLMVVDQIANCTSTSSPWKGFKHHN